MPSSAPLGLTYIVVLRNQTDGNSSGFKDDGRRVPFLFLMDLESIFRSKYLGKVVGGSVDDLRATPALDKDLRDLLIRADRGENDVSGLARQEIEQVKTIMIENVERVLERGERINLLVSKTDRMNNNAVEFRKRAGTVKRQMKWQNIKYVFFLWGVVCWGKCTYILTLLEVSGDTGAIHHLFDLPVYGHFVWPSW